MFQIITVSSLEHEASKPPPIVIVTLLTQSECCCSVDSKKPEVVSQILMVWSLEQLIRWSPFGFKNSTHDTSCSWPFKVL